jgi:hypothetical protein
MSGQAKGRKQRLPLLASQLFQDFPILLRALCIGPAIRFVGLGLIFHDFFPFLRV